MLVEKPPLADAGGASPKANREDAVLDNKVSGREHQLECLIKQQASQIAKLEARIEEMSAKIDDLSADQFNHSINGHPDIRQDIKDLPRQSAQPKQKNRGEILIALLAATPHGKMLESEARHKMDMSKSSFSTLLGTLGGEIETKPWDKDRRKKILRLK